MSAPVISRGAYRIAEQDDRLAWDEFALGAPTATFCHLAGWREVMQDVLGHECRYRVAHDADGGCRAILPLVRMRSRLFGHHLVSMPFLNYGGPAGNAAAGEALVQDALDEARRSGAHLELRRRFPDQAGGALGSARPKVTVLLALPGDAEQLWAAFPAKLRSQVRRPQKEGMELRFGAEQTGAFYEVFSRNMRDLGTPVHPRALFERLPRALPEATLFGTVYHGDVPVAAGCGFLWRGEFEMTWASSLREFKRSAPNMLLYWGFMEEVQRRGARTFNFGRCTPDGGTHRFKLQWGGRDEPLPWSAWPPEGGAPSPDGGIFALATRVWSRLPLGLTNRLGPVVAKRIPTF